MSQNIPCPSCQKPDQPTPEEINLQAAEYISALDEDIKTPPDEYLARTEICRSCENLLCSTTCRMCGCFYLMRAAVAHRHCPQGKW